METIMIYVMRQFKDLAKISAKFLLGFCGFSYLIVLILNNSIAKVFHAKELTLAQTVLGVTLYPLIGLLVFIPYLFYNTKKRKNDPFRFSRKLEGYFSINTQHLSFEDLKNELKKKNREINFVSEGGFYIVWNFLDDSKKNETRHISFQLLNKGQEILRISIEPENSMRIFDSGNKNLVAMNEIVNDLNLFKSRIDVDENGNPIFKLNN